MRLSNDIHGVKILKKKYKVSSIPHVFVSLEEKLVVFQIRKFILDAQK